MGWGERRGGRRRRATCLSGGAAAGARAVRLCRARAPPAAAAHGLRRPPRASMLCGASAAARSMRAPVVWRMLHALLRVRTCPRSRKACSARLGASGRAAGAPAGLPAGAAPGAAAGATAGAGTAATGGAAPCGGGTAPTRVCAVATAGAAACASACSPHLSPPPPPWTPDAAFSLPPSLQSGALGRNRHRLPILHADNAADARAACPVEASRTCRAGEACACAPPRRSPLRCRRRRHC